MNWNELIRTVAERGGVSQAQARASLEAMVDIAGEQLERGEELTLRGLGTLGLVWHPPRVLRSVADARRMVLDGRYAPQFRPSAGLKRKVAGRTPQHWRDPRHQEAWRVAETLTGDLHLYHSNMAPEDLNSDTPLAEVNAACRDAFGGMWMQVVTAYEASVPADVRAETDHLAEAARRRWAQG